jgi:hypothetical protein
MTQEPSRFTPDVPKGPNADCLPTSVVMALRLVGRDVPGFHGQHTHAAVDAARRLVTGRDDRHAGVDPRLVTRALDKLHVPSVATGHIRSLLAAVRAGHPVILSGHEEAQGTWMRPHGFSWGPMQDMHAVVLSGYTAARHAYSLNDPANPGVLAVTRRQIASFVKGSPFPGIVVGASRVRRFGRSRAHAVAHARAGVAHVTHPAHAARHAHHGAANVAHAHKR